MRSPRKVCVFLNFDHESANKKTNNRANKKTRQKLVNFYAFAYVVVDSCRLPFRTVNLSPWTKQIMWIEVDRWFTHLFGGFLFFVFGFVSPIFGPIEIERPSSYLFFQSEGSKYKIAEHWNKYRRIKPDHSKPQNNLNVHVEMFAQLSIQLEGFFFPAFASLFRFSSVDYGCSLWSVCMYIVHSRQRLKMIYDRNECNERIREKKKKI